mmetsp:Transcript_4064/g.5321  ORF Transcript_4064/g.5321 Transcript_4064/m.5321 type:complete len:327 (+) Transcript_4064:92-1072(+)
MCQSSTEKSSLQSESGNDVKVIFSQDELCKQLGMVAKGLVALKWMSPLKILPHGLSGLICLTTGMYLVGCAIAGKTVQISIPLVLVYFSSTIVNAVGGILLSSMAPSWSRPLFRTAAILQSALSYFGLRFFHLPLLLGSEPHADFDFMQFCDDFFAIILVTTILTIAQFTWNSVKKRCGIWTAASIYVGCLSLTLLAGYPLQLAFGGGSSWYSCVLQKYPMQHVGFVHYVYIPATFSFAAMLFGATLLNRKIIGNTCFGMVFLGVILLTLALTVISQEIHIPFVSTQKLFLYCPQSDEFGSSWLPTIEENLDISRAVQNLFLYINA